MGKKLEDNEAVKKILHEEGRWQEFRDIRAKNLDERGLLKGVRKREIWAEMGYDPFGGKLNEPQPSVKKGVQKTVQSGTAKSGVGKLQKAPKREAVVKPREPSGENKATDDVQHVFEALGGAEGWIIACKNDKSVLNDFYRNIWRPRVESDRKKNIDLVDDGRPALEMVESLLKQVKE